ncbi:hypothetical protein PFDG_04645 [Plasmodium falciparum Dd2]|uniref:Uncharacterized protein n=1 Tax=Plasmodium falciparum (isolate Dd2) TaxID=57267 RepID=A0A0L7M5L2_PLAF4|nr:hypothetical protein PFDG_04645 [Plasmodium falciparum Dd2]
MKNNDKKDTPNKGSAGKRTPSKKLKGTLIGDDSKSRQDSYVERRRSPSNSKYLHLHYTCLYIHIL